MMTEKQFIAADEKVVQNQSTLSSESRRRGRLPAKRRHVVYFTDGLSQRQRKLIAALLRWRYGLTERAFDIDSASVIIAATETEVSSLLASLGGNDKVVLPGYDLLLLREMADSILEVTGQFPVILCPEGDKWLIAQLRNRGYRLRCAENIVDALKKFEQARNHEQQNTIRAEISRLLIDLFEDVDYVVVTERCGPLHLVIASYASILGKPTLAETTSPIMSAIADSFVRRREDLIALVDAITTCGGGRR